MKERKKPSQSWIEKSIEEIEKEIKMEREEAFCIDWYMVRKMNKTPTFADAIEWADKTMIEKVCDWIQCMALDYMQGDITDVKWESMFADLRKYLENGDN